MMDQILGQDHALDVLDAALRSDRVHHAWIFSGPFGVGKFTTAVAFARLLLDPDARTDMMGRITVDPASRTQTMIDAESHADLHIIRKELALYSNNPALRSRKLMNIPVDLLRERMLGGRTGDDRTHEAPAYRTPTHGHAKVFIIDEAELLDTTAQNTLLKTLEEPPAATFIILVTSQPERLLPTVHSRCQHVRFRALETADMQRWFERRKDDLDPLQQEWLTMFAHGAPGVADRAATYSFHAWTQAIDQHWRERSAGRFPDGLGETLAELVDEFAKQWVKAHQNSSKDAANKDGAQHVFALLSSMIRQDLAQACDRNDVDALHAACQAIDDLSTAEQLLRSNVNMKLVFEHLSARLCRPVVV